MRIIAGAAKGRRLESPPGQVTRPMTDRVREALFSSLLASIPDADVLDLFAGSGSIGLEALSRGAASATFVEQDRAVLDVLRRNVEVVGLGGDVVAGDAEGFGADAPDGDERRYDVVFVDPPYALPLASAVAMLEKLSRRIAPGGIVVLHRRAGGDEPAPDGYRLVDRRRYGDSELWRFERLGS